MQCGIEMRRRAFKVGFGMIEVEERGRLEKGGTASWTGPVVSEQATVLLDKKGGRGQGRRATVGDSGRGWASTVCEWSSGPGVASKRPIRDPSPAAPSPASIPLATCCQATRAAHCREKARTRTQCLDASGKRSSITLHLLCGGTR